ncbi:MAG TPA: DUF1207 domain-containing protein [Longimicrobiales bacterium]|nr:DUF1207 domain-containing protein [Longimicrobiales bacterium]
MPPALGTTRGVLTWVAVVGGLVAAPDVAAAQTPVSLDAESVRVDSAAGWLPDVRLFPSPIADPREPAFQAGLLWTDIFQGTATGAAVLNRAHPEEAAHELHGAVSIGGTLPLRAWTPWSDGGVTVGLQAGVFGRFRLQVPKKDLVASDWIVAMPVEVSRGPLSARLRLLHWSSHLGDEFAEATGSERINFAHNSIEVLAALRPTPGVRVYGGGSLVFLSKTERDLRPRLPGFSDDGSIRAGAEGEWYLRAEDRVGIVAALDWQAADRWEWRGRTALELAVTARGPARYVRFGATFATGPTPMGQLLFERETAWGVNLVIGM